MSAPGQAGFPDRLRQWRQLRKLSQLELALHAGISQRHLSFMELGRSQPSRDMVLRLGEAMDLPLRDRNAMLEAAGFAAQFRHSALDDATMARVMGVLRQMLDHHEPYPALVVDRDWNVLAVNRAVHRVFGVVGDIDAMWQAVSGDGPRNVFRAMFHPQGLRPFLLNWQVAAPAVIARTRHEAEHNHSPVLWQMLRELDHDPETPEEWMAAVASPGVPVIPLELGFGDFRLALFSMISTFGTPCDVTTDEIRVETFYPADDGSATLMRRLAGGD